SRRAAGRSHCRRKGEIATAATGDRSRSEQVARPATILECGDWSPLSRRATRRPAQQDESRCAKAPTSRRTPQKLRLRLRCTEDQRRKKTSLPSTLRSISRRPRLPPKTATEDGSFASVRIRVM